MKFSFQFIIVFVVVVIIIFISVKADMSETPMANVRQWNSCILTDTEDGCHLQQDKAVLHKAIETKMQ